MRFTGTNGDDDFSGTTGKDKFDMSQGGDDTVFGQGGKDLFYFGAAFTAADSIDGGVKTVDHKIKVLGTVELNGDYSAGVVFGAQTMTNIAHLVLDGGHSYNLTLNETTVGAGRQLAVDGLGLGAGDSLVIDNSADTDGHILVKTNAGHVDLVGGAEADSFYLGATLDETDHIDGGAGFDPNHLFLKGDYAGTLVLDSSWISNIGVLQLGTGHYSFIAHDSFSSSKVAVNGGTDAVADFDASAETTASYSFTDLTGTLKGGGGGDAFSEITGSAIGNGGDDSFTHVAGTADGGSGNDTFSFVNGTILGGDGGDHYTSCTGTFDAGTGNDVFSNSSGTFHLEQSGEIRFDGGAGNSTLFFGASYGKDDIVERGTGVITAVFDGDYSQLTALNSPFGVDKLVLTAGHDYNLEIKNNTFHDGDKFEIDAGTLGSGDALSFDGDGIRNVNFTITGGAGDDTITTDSRRDTVKGGAGDDVISDSGGGDTLMGESGDDTISSFASGHLTGGTGADILKGGVSEETTFIYDTAQDSFSTHYDTVVNFEVAFDLFQLAVDVSGVDHFVSGGALDSTMGDAAFDADLSAALNGHLTAHHAIVFTPDSGNLAGDVFLIVDQNGVAGYQGGEDLVIRLDGGSNLTDINIGNFG